VNALRALVVSAALLAAATPVAHATPASGGLVYVVRATSTRSPALVLEVAATAAGTEGLLMTFSTVGRPARLYGGIGVTEFGTDATPRLWYQGSPGAECPAAAPCAALNRGGTLRMRIEATRAETVYVGLFAANATVTASRGWSVQVRRGAFHRVGTSSDTARVESVPTSTMTVSAERFAEAVAPGGTAGSAIFASVPCELAGNGTAELTGGRRTALDCGDMSAVVDLTTRRTTWRLRGDVVGVTGLRTRLAVIDLSP
jgi:hypothetical protein